MSSNDAQKVEAAIRRAYELYNTGDVARAKKALAAGKPGSLAHPVGLTLSGMIARGEGDAARALEAFETALGERPGDPNLQWLRGAALGDLGRHAEGLEAIETALAARPAMPKARFERGRILMALKRPKDALAAFDAALEAQPAWREALVERGKALEALGERGHAVASYDIALMIDANDAECRRLRADALGVLGRFDEAIADAEILTTERPNEIADARRLVKLLSEAQRFEDIPPHLPKLMKTAGGRCMAEGARAVVHAAAGEDEAALAAFERASAIGTLDDWFLASRGMSKLALGRWPDGFEDYERRLTFAAAPVSLPLMRWPRLKPGEAVAGKRVLVLGEQGLGDAIQFCRYLCRLVADGAEVTCSVPSPLRALISTLPAPVTLLDHVDMKIAYDAVVPMMSLPRHYGDTTETVPATVPYLAADPERVALWRERLGDTGFRIGVNWGAKVDARAIRGRSFPLTMLASLGAIEGVRLISLQKKIDEAEWDARPEGLEIERLGEDFDAGSQAFLDTAAVMACCDLVVTCDTSVAHVAGALGRPTFLALKHAPDWRWLKGRVDSPFYPTMRLFRQPEPGAWAPVFEAMAAAVAERIGA